MKNFKIISIILLTFILVMSPEFCYTGQKELAYPNKTDQPISHADPVITLGALRPGWPKNLGENEYPTDINFSDLDNDGKLDILVSTINKVFAIKENGEAVNGWPFTMPSKYCIRCIRGLATEDINEDGFNEIVASTEREPLSPCGLEPHNLFLLSHDGRIIPPWPYHQEFIYWFQTNMPPTIGYFDNSYKIFMGGCYSPGGHFYLDRFLAVDPDAINLYGFPLETNEGGFNFLLWSEITLGDFDGDSYPELLASRISLPSFNTFVYLINHDGSFNILRWMGNGRAVALGDIDNDSKPELITTQQSNEESECKMVVYDSYEWLKPGWPQYIGNIEATSPILADIDRDKYAEIIELFYDRNQGINKIYAFNHDGILVPGWPIEINRITESNNLFFLSIPVVGNIDFSPELEIISLSSEGYLYAFRSNGTTVAGYPKRIVGTENEEWVWHGLNFYGGKPSLIDIDDDGLTELIFYWRNGNVYLYDFPGKYTNKGTWSMFRYNSRRDGFYRRFPFINKPLTIEPTSQK